jgi:chromosome segregation ATPase
MTSCYHPPMSENDSNLINFIATTVEALRQRVDEISEQMATKVDIANLRAEMADLKSEMATKEELAAVKEQMATKEDLANLEMRLRADLATKSDLNRVETTMHGEFEQVHIRLDSLDRRMGGRMSQIETDVSRLRSVVYLLVKDDPNMLRILGQPTPGEGPPQG